ncbi:hypothetical protein UMZ34_19885 [Halopseudomonas pachastrellae]|nr:hypothetical protein UMZ34_19885 [Halopseudomonas pachastrellae]
MAEIAEQTEQLQSKHADAKAELDELESGMDMVQRVIGLSSTPEHAEAIAKVDLIEDQLELLENEQEKAENGLALIQRERAAAEKSEDSGGSWAPWAIHFLP